MAKRPGHASWCVRPDFHKGTCLDEKAFAAWEGSRAEAMAAATQAIDDVHGDCVPAKEFMAFVDFVRNYDPSIVDAYVFIGNLPKSALEAPHG